MDLKDFDEGVGYTYMMKMKLNNIILMTSLLLMPMMALAQGSFESYAEYLPIADENVLDGDIISVDGESYHRSTTAYDIRYYGVVNQQPAVGLSVVGGDNTQPIVTSGTVSVNVSVVNGEIKPGDFITTSDIVGVGMRANDPGNVIGTATEGFNPINPEEIGQVQVALDKHFAVSPGGEQLDIPRTIGSQVRNALVTGAVQAVSDPNTALRYIVAAIIVIISLLFGLLVFGRSATKGVEAIGRNPLAKRTIMLAIGFNVFMTIAFIAGGVVVAFFILAL